MVVTITIQEEEDGTKPEEELCFGVAVAVVEDDRGVGGVRHALVVVQYLQVQHEGEHHLKFCCIHVDDWI